MWTTRDLQDAAAAGALVEDFESEEDDFFSDFLSDDFVSDDEAAGVAAGVPEDEPLDEPDRLSVR